MAMSETTIESVPETPVGLFDITQLAMKWDEERPVECRVKISPYERLLVFLRMVKELDQEGKFIFTLYLASSCLALILLGCNNAYGWSFISVQVFVLLIVIFILSLMRLGTYAKRDRFTIERLEKQEAECEGLVRFLKGSHLEGDLKVNLLLQMCSRQEADNQSGRQYVFSVYVAVLFGVSGLLVSLYAGELQKIVPGTNAGLLIIAFALMLIAPIMIFNGGSKKAECVRAFRQTIQCACLQGYLLKPFDSRPIPPKSVLRDNCFDCCRSIINYHYARSYGLQVGLGGFAAFSEDNRKQQQKEQPVTTTQSDQLVIVVDFGAQYGQLIARRVRDQHVYSEIVPCDVSAEEVRAMAPAAIILSGGPASVYADDAPSIDPEIFELGIPVLGFCYGQQIMAVTLGGAVGHTEKGEYGPAPLSRCDTDAPSALFGDTPAEQTVWMSHRDAVSQVPEGFVVTSQTDVCPVASMECAERKLYATQFHPEVRHTPYGNDLLRNFLFEICGLEPNWTMDSIIEDSVAAIRKQVGNSRVILGLSGGVDSSVVAALCAKAIGKQLTCVFVNHGLLRKNEPEEVEEVFTKQFDVDFVHVHAEERYANLLAGVTEPEAKRKIIGTQFWEEFFSVAQDLAQGGRPVQFLAQGTIYPDIIESGARKTGGKASTIKSHHNLIPFPEGVHFDLIEPLDHFFKDEVRALGTALGLPDHIVHRQPFPGPGLAIRIIGDVTPEKLEILKNADAIVREELDAYNQRLFEQTGERGGEQAREVAGGPEVERPVWQYFAVLPDVKSVGVMGDERTYARPIILRAVESSDAMTADWAKLPYDVLARISSRIVAEVPGVNRVAYDITSKPPATIEWE